MVTFNVMFNGMVCFLYRHFPGRGHVLLTSNCIDWRGVLYCWWMRFFFCVLLIIRVMLFLQL